jgi:hypothetical protein
MTFDGLW